MKKKACYIAAVAALGALALTACKGGSTGTASSDKAASSQEAEVKLEAPAQGAANTISVEASESMKLTPDMAELGFGVTKDAATIDEVTAQCSDAVNEILEYLRSLGYADESISTSDIGLYPQYDYSNQQTKLTGYRMDTTIKLTDVPAEKVGEVLSGALDHGVNTINSIRYFSSGYDGAYEEALNKALARAEAKASAIAGYAGAELSGIVSIEEHMPNDSARYSSTNGYMEYGSASNLKRAAGGAALDMAVLPGPVEASASVTVVYEMK